MTLQLNLSTLWRCMGLGLCLSLISGCSLHQPIRQAQGPVRYGANHPAEELIEAKPTWFGCRVDNDCQVERGVCNEMQGVNRAFIEPFRQYRNKMSQSVDCLNATLEKVNGPSKCVANRCTVNVSKAKQLPH
jgi:hypothetical protein